VLTGARQAGDTEIEGKALTALAEVALLREANVPKATELIDAALDVLPDMGRFTALGVRSRIAWFVGDFQTQESASDEALEIARRLERKDLEAEALNSLAAVYKHQWRLDEAEEMLDRGLELAEESGSIGARSLFSEIGESWMLGRTMNTLAWAAEQQGDLRLSERLLREAIGVLKRLEDRGTLCESQRALAEVLVRKGSIDEAERLALEALETVGEHDLSSRATTSMTMALVRAAQGRDDEAEALLDESLAMIEPTDFRGLEAWIISRLEEYLRERGRDEEADVYARRLAELSPASGVATAFAARIDRIA
jgi:tetratricopeptide (TPR) repeat protein